MNALAARPVLRWLIRDTFRQSLTSGIFWLMVVFSTLTAGVCLTVRLTNLAPQTTAGTARLELLDGAIAINVPNPRAYPIRTLQLQLAGWVADAGGLLLALIWTAGFLPSFLELGAVTVLLAKPVPRWSLLVPPENVLMAFSRSSSMARRVRRRRKTALEARRMEP